MTLGISTFRMNELLIRLGSKERVKDDDFVKNQVADLFDLILDRIDAIESQVDELEKK